MLRRSPFLRLGSCPEHSFTASADVDDAERILPLHLAAAAPGALGGVPNIHIPTEYLYEISNGDVRAMSA